MLKKLSIRSFVILSLSALSAALVFAVVFIVGVSNAKIPESPTAMGQRSAITIVANDNKTVLAKVQPKDGSRDVVQSDQISDNMKHAMISAEDATFYDNFGFAPKRIAAAALGRVTGKGGSAGGGSTITQQFVKNTLVGDEYSLKRKWKEVLSSTKLTAAWEKDDIITAYLNTVYFGRGALGIERAAQNYFGVHADELTKAQSAVLAGVVQSPSANDPAVNRKQAEDRFSYVTEQMKKNGYLSEDEFKNIKYPDTLPGDTREESTGLTDAKGHIVSYALAELDRKGMDSDRLFDAGARIVTTIDPDVQTALEEESRNVANANDVRVSTVSIDPSTGGIRGMFGGDNGLGMDYATTPQMTGSTFKVYTLAAALENGQTLGDQISSAPYPVGNTVIENSDGMTCGTCSIAEATKQSLNTSFYRIQDKLPHQENTTRDFAHMMGNNSPLSESDGSVNKGITLGLYGSSPVQMANGIATVASGGIRNDRHIVDSVYTRAGQLIFRSNSHPTRVLSQSTTDQIDQALAPIAAYSNGHQLTGKQGYMKTGTVQLGDTGQNRDAWVTGYTDHLATAVWVGTDDGSPLTTAGGAMVWGAGLPADVWQSVMNRVG